MKALKYKVGIPLMLVAALLLINPTANVRASNNDSAESTKEKERTIYMKQPWI